LPCRRRDKKQRADILNMQNERNELFKQLGELKFQNEWLKKTALIPQKERMALLDRHDRKRNL
jgi:hypothetical protein